MANRSENEYQDVIKSLKSARPTPGSHFLDRMSAAPWQTEGAALRAPPRRLHTGLAFALAMLVGLLVLATPLRTTASQLFNHFLLANDDINTFEVDPGASPPNFELSHAQVESLAGYQVGRAEVVPSAFEMSRYAYDTSRQAVMQDFASPLPGQLLRLTQMRFNDPVYNYGQAGPSAEIRQISLSLAGGGTAIAEYVIGAWRVPPMQPALETAHPNISVTMQASWNPDANVHMLRWVANGFLYEIIHADPMIDEPEPQLLISMAEGIK